MALVPMVLAANALGVLLSAAPEASHPTARLPGPAGRYAPALLSAPQGAPHLAGELADTEACGSCHPDALAQWRTSAHAFASFNNPLYRASIDRLRTERGTTPSRACAGCHDPVLLVAGAMDAAEVVAEDARAHAGVTCVYCHSAQAVRLDGNGSVTLSDAVIALPDEDDAESVRVHKASAAPSPLRTAELCAGCHRSFLDAETGNAVTFFGMDDYTPWLRSAYAGSHAERPDRVAERDCAGCHMPLELAPLGDVAARSKGGRIASHRFVGGHSYLSAMRNDAAGVARVQAFLRDRVSVDIAAASEGGRRALPAETLAVRPGTEVTLDVVLRNRAVGHRFPGGVGDAQDTWLEVRVEDALGRAVAEAGVEHLSSGAFREAEPAPSAVGEDPTAHRLRSLVLDARGQPLLERQTHHFIAAAFNHTLGPRDAAVVRFSFDVPATLGAASLPLKASARLLHRSRNRDLHRLACEATRTERGLRFARASERFVGAALDACVSQPVSELAAASVWLGSGAERVALPLRKDWERLYEHGLGLSRALQEQLYEARESLLAALEAVERAGLSAPEERQARGEISTALATVAAKEGRLDEALRWTERAEVLLPEAPALSRIRGDAYAAVWRWPEAAQAYEVCTQRAPSDLFAWQALAMARGSAADFPGALRASQAGLALQPRDPELLRVQALSLAALKAPKADAEAALAESLKRRAPDQAPWARSLCSKQVLGCATERVPVHVHRMAPAGRPSLSRR